MADVNLTGDASKLIRELSRAGDALGDIIKDFREIRDESKKFNEAGQLQERTIKLLSRSGRQLTLAIKNIGTEQQSLTATTQNATKATREQAKALRELRKAGRGAASALKVPETPKSQQRLDSIQKRLSDPEGRASAAAAEALSLRAQADAASSAAQNAPLQDRIRLIQTSIVLQQQADAARKLAFHEALNQGEQLGAQLLRANEIQKFALSAGRNVTKEAEALVVAREASIAAAAKEEKIQERIVQQLRFASLAAEARDAPRQPEGAIGGVVDRDVSEGLGIVGAVKSTNELVEAAEKRVRVNRELLDILQQTGNTLQTTNVEALLLNEIWEDGARLGHRLEVEVDGVAEAGERAARNAKVLGEQLRFAELRAEALKAVADKTKFVGTRVGDDPGDFTAEFRGGVPRVPGQVGAPVGPPDDPEPFITRGRPRAPGQIGDIVDFNVEESRLLTNELVKQVAESRLLAVQSAARSTKAGEILRAETSIEAALAARLRLEKALVVALGEGAKLFSNQTRLIEEQARTLERVGKIEGGINTLKENAKKLRESAVKQEKEKTEELKKQLIEQNKLRQGVFPVDVDKPFDPSGPRSGASPLSAEIRKGASVSSAANRLRNRNLLNQALDKSANKLSRINAFTQLVEENTKKILRARKANNVTLDQTRAIANKIKKSFAGLFSVAGVSLFIGAVFQLQNALIEATRASAELSIKIAEIETITKQGAFATSEWAESLRDLSSEFGLDVLDQAEGAYQILSNQIKNAAGAAIEGADAVRFLGAANKLAVTGVTSTENAVNLLTAAVNAFNIPSEEAEITAAKLFKTVELGRVRIEELSQAFGRIGVPANQLGITFEELLGAIGQTTIQGVKFNEAATFLRGIIQKLLKPTDALKKILRDLGVESGEALIQQRGFIGALREIEQATDGSSTELAKIFNRIRALTGAFIFTGKGADEAAAKIKEIGTVTRDSFNQDTQRVIQSTGQQLKIAAEEAKNFFSKEIGQPATDAVAKIIKELGGFTNIINQTITATKILAKSLFVGLSLAGLGQLAVAFHTLAAAEGIATIAAFGLAKSLIAVNVVLHTLLANPVFVAAALGAAFVAWSLSVEAASEEVLRLQEETLKKLKKNSQEAIDTAIANQRKLTQATTRAVGRQFAAEEKKNIKLSLELSKRDKELVESEKAARSGFKKTLNSFKSLASKNTAQATRAFKKFSKSAKDAAVVIEKIFTGAGREQFQIDFNIAGSGQQIELIEDELVDANRNIQKAVEDSDLKAFKRAQKRIEELTKQRVNSELSFVREASKLNERSIQARVQLLTATGRVERERAQARLQAIQKQQKILKNGNAAQLKAAKDLEEANEKARTATTAAEFIAALDQIKKIKDEQKRLNTLADTERKIRKATLDDRIRLAKEAKKIQDANERAAKAAQAEQIRVKALETLFGLVREEAEGFKTEEVLAQKSSSKIADDVKVQLSRLAQLKSLVQEIGGDAAAARIFDKKSANLLERANIKLKQREQQAKAARLKEIKEASAASLAGARATLDEDQKRLGVTKERAKLALEELKANKGLAETRGFPARARAGRLQEVLRGEEGFRQTGLAGKAPPGAEPALAKNFDRIVALTSSLDRAIALQSADPSIAGAGDISDISSLLQNLIKPLLAIPQVDGDLKKESDALRAQLKTILTTAETAKIFSDRITQGNEAIRKRSKESRKLSKETEKEVVKRKTLNDFLEQHNQLYQEFLIDFESGREVRFGQGPLSIKGAKRPKTQKEIEAELNRGIPSSPVQTGEAARVAREAGKARAKADTDQQRADAPSLAAEKARLEKAARRREEQTTPVGVTPSTTPKFQPKPIDTRIQLGRGALPIAVQQRAIQAQLNQRAKERAAVRKKQREDQDRARKELLARAITAKQAKRAGQRRTLISGTGGEIITLFGEGIKRAGPKDAPTKSIQEQGLAEAKLQTVLLQQVAGKKPQVDFAKSPRTTPFISKQDLTAQLLNAQLQARADARPLPGVDPPDELSGQFGRAPKTVRRGDVTINGGVTNSVGPTTVNINGAQDIKGVSIAVEQVLRKRRRQLGTDTYFGGKRR